MDNDRRNHFRRIALLWLVATVILTPIVVFVVGPGIPPGNGTVEASGQVTDNTVLLGARDAGGARGAHVLRLRAHGIPRARHERRPRRPADPRQREQSRCGGS